MKGNGLQWGTRAVLTLAVLPVLTGCNSMLVGSWKTDPVPEDEPFYIVQAEFKDDGTYQASARKDGKDVPPLKGAFDFNGFQLKLKSPGKEDRVYGATYIRGGTLKLTAGDTKLTMKKQ